MTMFNAKVSGLTRMNICSGASFKKNYSMELQQYYSFLVFKITDTAMQNDTLNNCNVYIKN